MSPTHGQVLESELGEEPYCPSTHYVTEMVQEGDLTSVPNSPPHVAGVVDLRSRTTSIIEPTVVFRIEDGDARSLRMIVFDAETGADNGGAGWLVDSVDRLVQVDPADVDESSAGDRDAIEGVLTQSDGFPHPERAPAVLAGSSGSKAFEHMRRSILNRVSDPRT